MNKSGYRADLILVLTTMLAAAGWIFSKETIQGLPPFGFIGMRFLVASICLLPFCFRQFGVVSIKNMFKAMGVGCLLGTALLIWIFAISISETLAAGAFIMSLSMLFAPIVAWILFKQTPQKMFWLSLPIAFIGMWFLAGAGNWQSSPNQIWFGLSALMFAIYFNVNSKYAQRIPTLLLTCLQLFTTGIMASILSLALEVPPETVNTSIWGWFVMSAVFATSLRYVLQTTGQKHTSSANAAIIMILEPVWIVVLSMIWYAEPMPLHKIIGCSFILLALLLYRAGAIIFNRIDRHVKTPVNP